MRYKNLTRVLALDLHPRHFGYVVVENSDKLLDWGVRSYRRKGNPAAVLIRKRLRPLLELWRPSLVVIRGMRQMPPRQNLLRERLLKQVVGEAKNHRVPVRLGPKLVSRSTKYENARLVAERFPVLACSLPPKRKPWESEHYSTSMFEALAFAVTHVSKRRVRN
jgi:hypothetical protein